LGFVAVEADVRLATGFALEGSPVRVEVVLTDLDGAPRAGSGSWRLFPVEQPAQTLLPAEMPPEHPNESPFAAPGDRLRPRWETNESPEIAMRAWPDGTERARGDAVHDAKGRAEIRLPALAPGVWRLRYETRDPYGARYETTKDFFVAGRRTPVA